MYKIVKRLFDFVLALIAFILLLPIFIPVILILSVTGEKEVFYLQNRVGFRNKHFKIWKFATMLKNSENIGTGSITVRDDPRVFPFGQFLRKTKINELPQVINVLLGNMSIVGPRPLMLVDFQKYNLEQQKTIYNCKPGITGIGSIVFRDEQQMFSNINMDPQEYYHKYIMPYKGNLEAWYQQNASLLVDLKIIFLTAWVIIFPNSNLYRSWLKDLPERP
ncbi:MAG: sugar transferase [Nitrosomonas sp.]|nr:sugar transferase [Nitrosomonas sp.]